MSVAAEPDAVSRLESENARLREHLVAVERYTAQTLLRATRLAQVISVLGHDIELNTLVERTATELAELFAADIALLMLGPDEALTIEGQWGVRATDIPSGTFAAPVLPGLDAGHPVTIGPADEQPLFDWLSMYRARHVAWARLHGSESSQGLLLLVRRSREPFADSEQQELRAIATRVALAIENGLLQRRTRRQLEQSHRLQELTTALAGSLEISDIAARVSDVLVSEVPVTACVVNIERDGELVPLTTTKSRPDAAQRWTQYPLEASGKRLGIVEVAGAPPSGGEGEDLLRHMIGLTSLALDKALIYEQTQQQARHDSLTGLLSHRVFQEMLERLLAARDPFSVVLIDIDDFKPINDLYGHQTGDDALREVAVNLRRSLRAGDSVFRIGGEEFCAVLPGAYEQDAHEIAERLRRNVARIVDPVPVTISLGVASYPLHGVDRDQLLGQADEALYASKRTGKNRTTMAGSAAPEARAPKEAPSLLALLHTKNEQTSRQGVQVAGLAVDIGRVLDVTPDRLAELRIAAKLHDIGNIGVPDRVLHKKGPLDAVEWDIIKTHPVLGAELLRAQGLHVAARFVLEHHEQPDGGGYPHGLRRDDIALESRMLHVADAFVAMTSDRPYREALPREEAMHELWRLRGTGFDAEVVDAVVLLEAERAADALATGSGAP